jgi:chaperonin cofactor prefoldin
MKTFKPEVVKEIYERHKERQKDIAYLDEKIKKLEKQRERLKKELKKGNGRENTYIIESEREEIERMG